jgi:hypothetical protein
MKTTIELPDDLYRAAKTEAAASGRKLKDLIEEGLRSALRASRRSGAGPSVGELMKDLRGVIDSGVDDLATNPKHMEGFGRDAGDRRHRTSRRLPRQA